MSGIPSRPLAGSLLVLLLALGGCTAGPGDDDAPAAQTGASATTEEDASEQSAREAGVDWTDPPAPIASVTIPGSESGGADAEVKLDLLTVTRRDQVVLVNYAVTPTSASEKQDNLYGWLGNQRPRPRLVDTKNLKLHEPLGERETTMQTEALGPRFSSGQTLYGYAMFAAPPQDVTHVDVAIVDSAPAFSGVEIQ